MGHRWIVLLLVAFGVATTASCRKTPSELRDQHLVQGDEFFQDKHFPQATVEYQKAVTADPQSIEARQRLAES